MKAQAAAVDVQAGEADHGDKGALKPGEPTPHKVGTFCVYQRGNANPRRVTIQSVSESPLLYVCTYLSGSTVRRCLNVAHSELVPVKPEDLASEGDVTQAQVETAKLLSEARVREKQLVDEKAAAALAVKRKGEAEKALGVEEERRKKALGEAEAAESKLKVRRQKAEEAAQKTEGAAAALLSSQQEEAAQREKQRVLQAQLKVQMVASKSAAESTKSAADVVAQTATLLAEGEVFRKAASQVAKGLGKRRDELREAAKGRGEASEKGEKGERRPRSSHSSSQEASEQDSDSDSGSSSDGSEKERLDLLRRKREREEADLEDRLQAKRRRKKRKKEKRQKAKKHRKRSRH